MSLYLDFHDFERNLNDGSIAHMTRLGNGDLMFTVGIDGRIIYGRNLGKIGEPYNGDVISSCQIFAFEMKRYITTR